MKIALVNVCGVSQYVCVKNGKYFAIEGDIFGKYVVTEKIVEGEIVVPVTPSKIVALGANYPKHNAELNSTVLKMAVKEHKKPLLFLKPPSSLIACGQTIELPFGSDNVHYEGELAIIIGKKCKNVEIENANEYIFGYTCANDVSDRTIQNEDTQWTRAKGFDTFCPLGSFIETEIDASAVQIKTTLNGKIVQDGNTSEMINKIDETISFISKVMTLFCGDVILMGTPQGVSKLSDGDICSIAIEGVSELTNNVIQLKE